MASRFFRSAGLIFGFLLLIGCGVNKNEEEAKNFVQNYCSILQLTYARADLNVLAQVTTEKELKKVFPVIQALKATGNIMKTEVLEFNIKKAKVKDDSAIVRTHERWRYWWEDGNTGSITKPKNEETYNLEYHLIKERNGQWKVDFIKNLDE